MREAGSGAAAIGQQARIRQDSTALRGPRRGTVDSHGPRLEVRAMWARNPVWRRLRLSVDHGNVARIFCKVQFDHVAQRVSDVAAALEWWQRMVPGATVLYADESWGMIEAGGAKVAFVLAEQHPDHLAYKVSQEELERLASQHGAEISGHRDGSRSFYVQAPGDHRVEVIAYPDVLEEDAE